jgi:2-methylisocitrate lyase-like PEP mutase family enzyme
MPGVANPLSARIAEDIGYEALYVTGAGVSNFSLGVPDIGLINTRDLTDTIMAIADVVEVPLVVDADTGFGNAVNAYHTVRKLEAAGASAIQLEDQVFPKKCGHFDGKEVVPVSEMTDKVKAAVDARRSGATQIIARTDACAVEGFQRAVERAEAYVEAGADITFVEALTTEEEMRTVPRRLRVPQVINIVFGGKTPPLPFEALDVMGFKIVLYANAALQAAIFSMDKVLRELHASGSLDKVKDELASFERRQAVIKKPLFDALERRYTERGGH